MNVDWVIVSMLAPFSQTLLQGGLKNVSHLPLSSATTLPRSKALTMLLYFVDKLHPFSWTSLSEDKEAQREGFD